MGEGGEVIHVSEVNVASHGCIHMKAADLAKIFGLLPKGTPVYVTPLRAWNLWAHNGPLTAAKYRVASDSISQTS